MVTNENSIAAKEKSFDAVKFMREQRDRLDAMFAKMTKEEMIAYLNSAPMRSSLKFSA